MSSRNPSWRAFTVIGLLAAPAFAQIQVQTTHPFVGVTHEHILTMLGGRPQSIQAVTIDLTAPGLSFRLTPQNGPLPQMTTEQTTRAFLIQQRAQIAVNTHFFTLDLLPTADLVGLAASDGDAYAPWVDGALSAGINIGPENAATLVLPGSTGGTSVTPAVPLWNAFGVSLTNGTDPRIVTSGVRTTGTNTFDLTPNPRTAVAMLPGDLILFMTVDGRQPGVAEGATLPELADLLIERYGAIDAINLDGGGSTTLAMDHAGARVMNVPVGLGDSFGPLAINTERANGANLAIFAVRQYGLEPARYLLAYEGFDDPARAWSDGSIARPEGGSVNGLAGGTGWLGPWRDTGTRWAGIVDFASPGAAAGGRTTPLHYTSAAGQALPTTGKQYRSSFGASSTSTRALDLSLVDPAMLRNGQLGADATTLWVSFLAQSHDGSGTTGTTQRHAYLQIGDGVRLGKLQNSPTGNWGMQDAGGGASVFSTISSASQVLYLARLEFRAGADHVDVWLNPRTLTDAATLGAPTMSLDVADFTFADISIVGRYSTDFDEIRIGRGMETVVPAAFDAPGP